MTSHHEFGRDVLRQEADAITRASRALADGAAFDAAVDAILACIAANGRVMVGGVGKPWFIAQKISATMASTGTPSFPLHPSDAAHGDIGRVRDGDVVILLSNSGRTAEVLQIAPMIRQFGATLIAIVGEADGALGQAAHICLAYGPIEEACPLRLAPSASTTAMLALGDALALSVQNARQFSREDYARFHPAGALGRGLMKVVEIMRPLGQTPLVASGGSIRDVLDIITRCRAGAAFVVDGAGKLVGIFTDGDLRRHVSRGLQLDETIDAHMTPGPRSIPPDRLVADALRLMREKRIDELPVVDPAGVPLGYLDVQDLLDVGLAITDR
ncbi:MAG: SIS domain-containing protein [Planctomycetota bacterium]